MKSNRARLAMKSRGVRSLHLRVCRIIEFLRTLAVTGVDSFTSLPPKPVWFRKR
jgi:hypothetical protein